MVWKSWHVAPTEVEDVFLVRVLRPYLRDVIWRQQGSKAFFVRYLDQTGPHLRIRIQGEPRWVEQVASPAFLEYTEGKCNSLQIVTYEPEAMRFGGAQALAYAEEHFHLSTQVAIARISRIPYVYGDALFDSLRMHCITAYAAGLDIADSSSYFRRLRDSWAPTFIRDENGNQLDQHGLTDLVDTFRHQLEPQRAMLTDSLSDVWYYMKQGLFDPKQPEWEAWYRGNRRIFQDLGKDAEIALPQLIHLHNNRMGVANYDEVYLCHILSEVLR